VLADTLHVPERHAGVRFSHRAIQQVRADTWAEMLRGAANLA
jgi:hypothetical protein